MLDVAIAGGGPAGASAALTLARAGLETLVVERSEFPRVKPCGEYLGAGALGQLRDLGVKDTLAPLASRLDGIRLSGNGVRVELRFSQPGWALPRADLDDALLQAAQHAGARVLRGQVEDVKSESGRAELTVREADGERRTVQARVVIGADGSHSIVAKKCGLTKPSRGTQRFALGGHYAGFRDLEPFVEMFVEGNSYFAVNPFDAARANVMLIVRENELTARKNDVDEFVRERAERLSGNALRFHDAHLEGKRIGFGPLAHAARALTAERVLLAGDAAGFLDPFTGQGVYLALRSGVAAAQTVTALLASPRSAKAFVGQYDTELRGEMRQRARLSTIVRVFVRSSLLSRRAAGVLQRDPARAQPLVDAVAGSGPVGAALRVGVLARLVA